MPDIQLEPNVSMHYRVDDFSSPWETRDFALFLHGNAESAVTWNGWMPSFGSRYRCIRPDMRGFGQSTPMPVDYPWSFDGIVDDYLKLLAHLDVDRFHLVGSKTGGPAALRLASRHPEMVRSLTLVGCPASGAAAAPDAPAMYAQMERDGVKGWAMSGMQKRLGSEATPEMLEAWGTLMGKTALSTQLGYVLLCAKVDIQPDLPRIACPTLVITTPGSGLASIDETRAWQEQIAQPCELLVLPGDSYHVAVSHPVQCATAALEFIGRHCA